MGGACSTAAASEPSPRAATSKPEAPKEMCIASPHGAPSIAAEELPTGCDGTVAQQELAYQGTITSTPPRTTGPVETIAWVYTSVGFAVDSIRLTDTSVIWKDQQLSEVVRNRIEGSLGLHQDGPDATAGQQQQPIAVWRWQEPSGVVGEPLLGHAARAGIVKLESGEYTLELLPQTHRFHFAVAGHPEALPLSMSLQERFNRQCQPSSQLRFWSSNSKLDRQLRSRTIKECPGFMLIITPSVWESAAVIEDVRSAEEDGKTVLVLYRPTEIMHVVSSKDVWPELQATPAATLAPIIDTAPEDLRKLFDFMEAIPLRTQPWMEAAVLRHVAQLGGCNKMLQHDKAPDAAAQLSLYLELALNFNQPPSHALPAPPPTQLTTEPGAQPNSPQPNPTQQCFYYEGVAFRPLAAADSRRSAASTPTTSTSHELRGWLQVDAAFDAPGSRVHLDVHYEPATDRSMPRYSRHLEMRWRPDTGELDEVEGSSALPLGPYWERWAGKLAGGPGSVMCLQEGDYTLLLRPMPFLRHFYLVGVATEVAALAGILTSLLAENAAPGRRPRLTTSFSLGVREREAALAGCKAVLLFLSPALWGDAASIADLELAHKLGKQVVLLQDPDPRMTSHVDVHTCMAAAPAMHRPLFDDHDVFPVYRRWYEQDAFVTNLLQAAGLDSCVKQPYQQEADEFVRSVAEHRSDIQELAALRAGLWLYYEGIAVRRTEVWGWYQIDAKFRPGLGRIELVTSFESKHPRSIPSYKAVFRMLWDRNDATAGGSAGGDGGRGSKAPPGRIAAALAALGRSVSRNMAQPPAHGDYVMLDEADPRWWGMLVGGVGGIFHIMNKYGDDLTFRPQHFVWHVFLSHVQRESSDACALLVARMAECSQSGRRARAWYDNNASGIVNKDAMALGVMRSQSFILMLSPSVFKSPYVKFEILSAAQQRKPIVMLYDPTPGLASWVDPQQLRGGAPPELHFLFEGPEPGQQGQGVGSGGPTSGSGAGPAVLLPFPAGSATGADGALVLDESVRAIMRACGLAHIMADVDGSEGVGEVA